MYNQFDFGSSQPTTAADPTQKSVVNVMATNQTPALLLRTDSSPFRGGDPCHSSTAIGGRAAASRQQPVSEKNSPCGLGRLGVNGWNLNVFDVLKPASSADSLSTNGMRASTAWLIEVQQRVRS